VKLRRNDPCHCGSGRKYKQCHLKTDQSREREERGLKSGAEWISFHGRSMREAVHGQTPGDAAVAFFETPPDAPLTDAGFEQHALYDLGDPPAISSAPLGDEKPEQRETLRETLRDTFATLLEVSECKRGKGVRFKDRLTDRELFVGDVELARTLEPMELVLGRLFVFEKRNVLHAGWEKVGFRGRKAVVSQFEQALDGVEDEDRPTWLKREAPSLYRAARASAHPT
jgi:hypothetical protein